MILESVGSSMHVRQVRDLTVFLVAFSTFWIAAVIAVWKLGVLPEAARPWFRTAVWVGACVLWIAWRRPHAPATWLGLWPIKAEQIGLAILAFAVIFAWNLLRVQVLAAPLGHLTAMAPRALAWSLVGVFVEELLFRGVVQGELAECFSSPTAILGAATLFLLIHVPGWIILDIPAGAVTVATVFLIGVICGALRLWSKSLWPAVAAHWSNNLGALL
jgi:membrane protease YdiL (CAAX protease family)